MTSAPFGENTSAGQADEFPVHVSPWSQFGSREGRHTCVAGANEHWLVQNLQVSGSQQVLDPRIPGSQSSPSSTMPLPHILREMVRRLGSGSTKHVVLVRPCMSEPVGKGVVVITICACGMRRFGLTNISEAAG
jgi:hypothetical protein